MWIKQVRVNYKTRQAESYGEDVETVFRDVMTGREDRWDQMPLGIEDQIRVLREFMGKLSRVLPDRKIITLEEWGGMIEKYGLEEHKETDR